MFDDELARILDREQPLVRRDQLDQCLGKGRLARAGRAAHQDVFAGGNGCLEESWPIADVALRDQLRIDFAKALRGGARASSESRICEQIGRASSRDRVCQYVYISVVAVSLTKNN